jgi:hypothetical protein
MNTLFLIVIILAIGWWIRNLHFHRVIKRYKFKLYALRDKLRMQLINGKVNENSPAFDFMEYSVSKSIQYLDCLNIYTLIFLSMKVRKEDDFIKFEREISKELKNDEALNGYFNELNSLIYEFLKKRFVVTHYIVHVLRLYIIGSNAIVQSIMSSLQSMAIMMRRVPEEKPVPVLLRSLLC